MEVNSMFLSVARIMQTDSALHINFYGHACYELVRC